jgi:hypothetical protein
VVRGGRGLGNAHRTMGVLADAGCTFPHCFDPACREAAAGALSSVACRATRRSREKTNKHRNTDIDRGRHLTW